MDDRYTRIRPAREHDGVSPARWFFYRANDDGTVTREEFLNYGFQAPPTYLYFVYSPELLDPPCPTTLPNLQTNQRGKRQPVLSRNRRRFPSLEQAPATRHPLAPKPRKRLAR